MAKFFKGIHPSQHISYQKRQNSDCTFKQTDPAFFLTIQYIILKENGQERPWSDYTDSEFELSFFLLTYMLNITSVNTVDSRYLELAYLQ